MRRLFRKYCKSTEASLFDSSLFCNTLLHVLKWQPAKKLGFPCHIRLRRPATRPASQLAAGTCLMSTRIGYLRKWTPASRALLQVSAWHRRLAGDSTVDLAAQNENKGGRMKKRAMSALATAMLSGSGMAMAGGGDFGAGLVAESLPGGLCGNAYASPAYVPAGYPAYYGAPHHWHRWHRHHWRPYYGDADGWRWRRHEWREHE